MRIAIPTSGNDLTAPFEKRFGRTPQFLIYDTDTAEINIINNAINLESPQGTGIQTAQIIAKAGAQAIISANVGPKAFQVLEKAQIDVYLFSADTVEQAVAEFNAGKLTKVDQANVEGHWA